MSKRDKLNKKGFVITPIIFIVFFLIAIVFSFYVSNIDKETAKGIQKSSAIEKGIHDIQKKQLNEINFVKISTYKCSKDYPFPCNESQLKNCVKEKLNEKFKEKEWDFDIKTDLSFEYNMSSFNLSNIHMKSNSSIKEEILAEEFLNQSCS